MFADTLRKGTRWIARRLIASQVALSCAFDQLLPPSFRVDRSKDFNIESSRATCVQVSSSTTSVAEHDHAWTSRPSAALGLTLTGVDLDEAQFAKAPRGLYDPAITADITTYQEQNAADLVVCKSTLEHVRDTEAALARMARLLNPGGTLLVFVPSRNALYARLNVLLPERLKLRLLSAFMPSQADHLGFPAIYDHCTPHHFRRFAARYGLQIKELRPYYISSYFSVVFPAYFLWRVWILAYRAIAREHAAESFVMIARKPERPAIEAWR
jgi:SAM-dependent methyltransferase